MYVLLPGSVHRKTATVVEREGDVAGRQVQRDVVRLDLQQPGPGLGLLAGDVHAGAGLGTDEAPRADARAAGRELAMAWQKDMESSHGQECPTQRE